MAKSKTKFDLTQWAKDSTNHSKRRHGCRTCRDTEVAEAIRTVLRLIIDGKSGATLAGLHQILCDNFGYDMSVTALRHHVKKCESELFKGYQEK